MVSAAHCRTPLARIRSALPLPLPRTGDPNRQSDRRRCGWSLANCMQAEPPYLAPIRWQRSIPSASRKRPMSAASSRRSSHSPAGSRDAPKPGRSGRMTRYCREMRNPAGPGARGFGVAVHHHHGLGHGPRLAKPMVLIGHPNPGADGPLRISLLRAAPRDFATLLLLRERCPQRLRCIRPRSGRICDCQ